MPRPARKPATPRRTPRQARGKASVDAILEAAARILRTQGPAALTTNRVSEVAGVGVGTLYGYFPDKAAILVALARRLLAQDEAAMLAALAGARGQDPLRVLVRTLLDRHRADAAVRRTVMSVHHARGLAAEHSQAAQRTIARLLDQAGDDLPRADPARLFVLTRALLGVARAAVEEAPPAGQDLEDELVRLAHLCLAAPGPTDIQGAGLL